MLPYTGGQPQARKAVLAVNLQGGGGLEVWQYARREPQAARFAAEPGDLGILAARIKARDVPAAHARFCAEGLELLGPVERDPAGEPGFFVRDRSGNTFHVVTGDGWFQRRPRGAPPTGGVSGAMIGVKSLEPALVLYRDILGFDRLVYDRQGVFPDLAGLPGGRQPLRRVLLAHSGPRRGAFSALLGPGRLELVQALEREPRKIFDGRFWGDLGFIHLCFDVRGMEALKERCARAGFPFTVDSAQAFVMGEGSGRFAYVEDPGGTLVEFVETYRLAVLRSLGWYLDLRRRPPEKRLPRWLLAALGLNRVRDKAGTRELE
jgi:catechol 2,3-dioxygenase-like lactoylglutathione lyase family enzyme